ARQRRSERRVENVRNVEVVGSSPITSTPQSSRSPVVPVSLKGPAHSRRATNVPLAQERALLGPPSARPRVRFGTRVARGSMVAEFTLSAGVAAARLFLRARPLISSQRPTLPDEVAERAGDAPVGLIQNVHVDASGDV